MNVALEIPCQLVPVSSGIGDKEVIAFFASLDRVGGGEVLPRISGLNPSLSVDGADGERSDSPMDISEGETVSIKLDAAHDSCLHSVDVLAKVVGRIASTLKLSSLHPCPKCRHTCRPKWWDVLPGHKSSRVCIPVRNVDTRVDHL
ncbi:hypothetical protein BgiMline_009558 [Biomphalaria glabrata]